MSFHTSIVSISQCYCKCDGYHRFNVCKITDIFTFWVLNRVVLVSLGEEGIMVAKKSLTNQLRQIGYRFRTFGRTEINELRRILEPGELIIQCVYGYYQGGSGLLVATDKRVLLVDKRPFYLYVENHSYDTITQIDFASHMLQGVLYFQAGLKRLIFKSVSDARLAKLCSYVQDKIDSIEKPEIISQVASNLNSKPYLNPAWRPHHITFLRSRPRPSKFYVRPTKPVIG